MSQSLTENYNNSARTSDKIPALQLIKQRLLGFSAALLLKLLYMTIRYKEVYTDSNLKWASITPTVIAFWHGEQLVMPLMWSKVRKISAIKTAHMLASQHSDGRIAANAISYFGIKNVFGSSSKGGKEASLALTEILNQGMIVGITPDGPKGPIYVAKPGVVRIAQLADANVLPIHGYASRAFRFKSWDKMALPLPFSSITIVFGKLITKELLASKGSFEEQLSFVEAELRSLQTQKILDPHHR